MFFVFCLSFIFSFILHPSCIIFYPCSYLIFFPFFFLIHLSIHDKKGESIPMCFRHFYMTHVHILRGRNSTLCTFVGGESHRIDVYTKGEKTYFFFFENLVLFCFTLCLFSRCFYSVLSWFELCLVSIICCSHCIILMCWTYIHSYVIVLYWLHIWMIICFAM